MPEILKLILTGDPGCGKTTVVRAVVEALRSTVPMTGFYTEEIRHAGRRAGFRGVLLDGRVFPLAHLDQPGEARVGPYGVDIAALEAHGLPALVPRPETGLVVLDEIGKMESLSVAFRDVVDGLLGSPVPLLATLPARGVGFVKRVRGDSRITLIHMSRDSRHAMAAELLRILGRAGVGGSRSQAQAGDRKP